MSPRVADALYALGYNVHRIGGTRQPAKATEDPEVLDHARKSNQTIVTSNHDMLLLCAEEGESVIWFDPKGDMNLRSMLRRSVDGIEDWERMLAESEGPVCVRVMKTKSSVIPLERAAHLVQQRIKAKERRERRRTRAAPQAEDLGLCDQTVTTDDVVDLA